MKGWSRVLLMALVCNIGIAQTKFFTKTGSVSFFSKTTVENITAKKYQDQSLSMDISFYQLVFIF